jgi:hypothetical protein
MIKVYLVEFTDKVTCVVRYLCGSHAKDVIRLKKELGVKYFIQIHTDVYKKKCHLCKRRV